MEEVEFGGVRGSPKIGHDFRTHLVTETVCAPSETGNCRRYLCFRRLTEARMK